MKKRNGTLLFADAIQLRSGKSLEAFDSYMIGNYPNSDLTSSFVFLLKRTFRHVHPRYWPCLVKISSSPLLHKRSQEVTNWLFLIFSTLSECARTIFIELFLLDCDLLLKGMFCKWHQYYALENLPLHTQLFHQIFIF